MEELADNQGNSRENSLNAIRPFMWKISEIKPFTY
jgi:hypothetical protein